MTARMDNDGSRRQRLGSGPEIVGLGKASETTIYPHVFGSPGREVGGVLVGRLSHKRLLPLITGAIPALSADEQRATLTFTHAAWQHVHHVLDHQFPPDEQIVGWYHSHPSFGIFLSEHDLFIHRNFFSGKFQIAVVVDPISATEGVFVRRGEDVVKLVERPTPQAWRPRLGPGAGGPTPTTRPWRALTSARSHSRSRSPR